MYKILNKYGLVCVGQNFLNGRCTQSKFGDYYSSMCQMSPVAGPIIRYPWYF